jgi:hypothetical protein
MSEEIYANLAKVLDTLPNGFPRMPSSFVICGWNLKPPSKFRSEPGARWTVSRRICGK